MKTLLAVLVLIVGFTAIAHADSVVSASEMANTYFSTTWNSEKVVVTYEPAFVTQDSVLGAKAKAVCDLALDMITSRAGVRAQMQSKGVQAACLSLSNIKELQGAGRSVEWLNSADGNTMTIAPYTFAFASRPRSLADRAQTFLIFAFWVGFGLVSHFWWKGFKARRIAQKGGL